MRAGGFPFRHNAEESMMPRHTSRDFNREAGVVVANKYLSQQHTFRCQQV